MTFSIKPCVDDKAKTVVCEHWKKAWEQRASDCCSAGDDDDDLLQPHWKDTTTDFLDHIQNDCNGRTFIAYDDDENETKARVDLGSISCQLWKGPVPIEVVSRSVLSIGTIWRLHVDKTTSRAVIAEALILRAKDHLYKIGCHKVIVLTLESTYPQAFLNCGFGPKNMLTLALHHETVRNFQLDNGIEQIQFHLEGSESDSIVVEHWRKMWTDVGIPKSGLVSGMEDITVEFIENARERLGYQTVVARRASDGMAVGSVSCQQWDGPFPKIAKPCVFNYGPIWAVYVDPDYRRKGTATALMRLALKHLSQIGCHRVVLIAASEPGQRVYERLGFQPNNSLVCDLADDTKSENKASTSTLPLELTDLQDELRKVLHTRCTDGFSDRAMKALVTATSQQLSAVVEAETERDTILSIVKNFQIEHGLYVDPLDNWFTRNVKRFGRGFDMQKLTQDEEALVAKFDRLSERYDHWTVGNKSKVEQFIVSCAKTRLTDKDGIIQVPSRQHRILDVACGIGLQGQTLRLCGYEGEIVGLDVSPGMIARALDRGCYDRAIVANANDVFPREIGNFDVVVCTGAMELLDHAATLKQIALVTKTEGELWVSFQGECDENSNPTGHQGLQGISNSMAIEKLGKAGFDVVSIEHRPDAFYTPSPEKNGSLLAVPYRFIIAKKRPNTTTEMN